MSDKTQRFEYMIECYRSARQEFLFRVQYRDNWLKLHLLAQATLLALSVGIKLGGASASKMMPIALSLSIPISLIFRWCRKSGYIDE